MELHWRRQGRTWQATLDGVDVARFDAPVFRRRTRVAIGDDRWLFTPSAGRPADADQRGPAPLTARKTSWFGSEREVTTGDGVWLVQFRGLFGTTLDLRRGVRIAGDVEPEGGRFEDRVRVRVRAELPLVDAVWLSWHALEMRWERANRFGGFGDGSGGGGGDGGG